MMHSSRKAELSRRARPRSSSQTNLNQLDVMERRATYGALRRSVSNSNLRTPQSSRPPAHSNRSPVRATPNVSAEQSRKQVVENGQKVMEVLQMDEAFFARINLVNGLKSMTAKQFIEIVAHFSMKISGKNMITTNGQNASNAKQKSTPEVEILSFLQMLNYPYVINKSCLKTPNAQHMFKECVALLAWLSDIVRFSSKDELAELPMNGGNEFPNESYTKHFSLEVQNAFPLWNEESDDEFYGIQDDLIESFVKAKRGCSSLQEMIQKAETLKKANAKLAQAPAANRYDDGEKAFETIHAKYNELKRQFEELKMCNATRIEAINRLKIVHKLKASEITGKKEALNALFEQIGKQRYTVADIQRISDKILLAKRAIASAEQEIARIREDATDLQIKVARLKQQRIATVQDLNALAFKIAQILAKSQDYERSVNVNDLCLDTSAASDAIQTVCMRLQCLYDNVAAHKQRTRHKIDQRTASITGLRIRCNHFESELKNLKTKYQAANTMLATIDGKLLQYQTATNVMSVQLEASTLNNEYDELVKEMAEKRKMIAQLEIDNLEILESGENCIYKIIQAKHNALEELDSVNKLLDDLKTKN